MSGEVKIEADPDQSMIYQIRLKGCLTGKWSEWFGGLTIIPDDNGETLITGTVKDQAVLHGLLRQVRDLGLPLISVNRIQKKEKK